MEQAQIMDLLGRMTVEEKALQLTGGNFKEILDYKTLQVEEKKAREQYPDSIGYFTRVGGSTDFTPLQVAKTTNALQKYFVEKTRLGIPLLFMTEGTSGVLARDNTLFPSNLNVGAMFSEELTYEMGEAIGRELRATGENWALAPVVDTIREFRYGRYEESYGEDIKLTANNGIAYVKGLQQDLKTGAAATLKHFAAQGISDGGRNTAPVHLGERELLDEYVYPFAQCIKEADPATVMAAYHELDGIPVHASAHMLKDILRDKLGFDGIVASDGNGIRLLQEYQEYCRTLEEAAVSSINAGVEVELDDVWKRYLSTEVQEGTVSMETLDAAVLKVLELKNKLGLFENPYADEAKVGEIVMCAKHLELSYKMACDSIILLKNENHILPLKKEIKVGLAGPLSDRKDFAYGDYSYPTHIKEVYYSCQGMSEEEILARSAFTMTQAKEYDELYHNTSTIYEELKKRFHVVQRDMLSDTYNYDNAPDFEQYQIDDELRSCDVLIAVLGETSGMGYKNDSGESTDRTGITLSPEQRRLLQKLKDTGKPVILVLANAKPVELSLEAELCDAIVEAFKTGYYGARAICDVLDGTVSPSGKLPVSIPKDIGQCPIYYSQRITGKKQFWRNTYLEMDLEALYEFGFGLSYTDFDIEIQQLACGNDGIEGRAFIKNTGEKAGSEVLQLYVKKRFGTVAHPERELKWYRKVFLQPGESKEIDIHVDVEELANHNAENRYLVEDMQVTAMIGTSSKNILREVTGELKFEEENRPVVSYGKESDQ